MKNGNLKINTNCIKCGSCLECGYSFLSAANDGSIIVEKGTFLKENGKEMGRLRDICPVDAFELDSSERKEEVLDKLIKELKNQKGIEKPTEEDLKFDKDSYSIPISTSRHNELKYIYSSYRKAEKAALEDFERTMYSQIDTIILKVITEYRVKIVKPYYTADEDEGSVYAKNNKKVSEILKGIKNILGDKLPDDFSVIDVMPDREFIWKMLNKGEVVAGELVSSVKSEFEYPATQYDCYWDTDSMETYTGKDWRGNLKFEEMYCYKDMRSAYEELAKDLLCASGWASEHIEGQAVRIAGDLVDAYNREFEKKIGEKIDLVDKV